MHRPYRYCFVIHGTVSALDHFSELDIISNILMPLIPEKIQMPGSLESIQERRTLADEVFHKLRDGIIDGTLQPGQWLRQEGLAQDLGVSQMPVREALKRLVAEGLAERIPYRGVKVVEFDAEDILDMFTIRMVLESLAARFAATAISDADLDRLRENVNRAAGLTGQSQMAERRQLNAEFHLVICRASERRFLTHQVEALWSWFPSVMLYEGMRRQEELSLARLERESREHTAILVALERRDAHLAEKTIRQHIRNVCVELAEVLGLPKEALATLDAL
jgi:DNA-binding GntR family transcriptional regulator